MRSQSVPRAKKSDKATGKHWKTTGPRRSTRPQPNWTSWWPLAAGIAITLAAVKTAEILPLMGPDGLFKLRLLYPFALLLKQPQLGLPEQTSDSWSQIMLYAQWVLYGLYASLAVHWTSLRRALLQIAALHAVGFGLLWFLAER